MGKHDGGAQIQSERTDMRNNQGLHAGLLGQLHGGVGGPIAVRAILRAHHGEFGGFRNQIVGQGTGFSGGDQIVGNGFNQFTKRFRTHSP